MLYVGYLLIQSWNRSTIKWDGSLKVKAQNFETICWKWNGESYNVFVELVSLWYVVTLLSKCTFVFEFMSAAHVLHDEKTLVRRNTLPAELELSKKHYCSRDKGNFYTFIYKVVFALLPYHLSNFVFSKTSWLYRTNDEHEPCTQCLKSCQIFLLNRLWYIWQISKIHSPQHIDQLFPEITSF